MKTIHRLLLDQAIGDFLPYAEPLKNAAVCITGASGFLAASLVAFFSELDRVGGLSLKLYANARRLPIDVPLFRFLDLSPKAIWTKAAVEDAVLPKVDNLFVVHAASYGSPRDYLREPIATFNANIQGLMQLFNQERKISRFVYFSSAEIYGQPPDGQIPTRETYFGGLNTLALRSIYGESKRMAEVLGVCLGEQKGVSFTAIRPWNVYGPGQRLEDGRVPMEFIRQAMQNKAIKLMSNGVPSRAFCHVWDAMKQIAAALCYSGKSAAFNVGNGTEEISILSLARRCAAACDLPVDAVTFDPCASVDGLQRCAPDVTAILTHIPSIQPFTSLNVGLATLVEWCEFLFKC